LRFARRETGVEKLFINSCTHPAADIFPACLVLSFFIPTFSYWTSKEAQSSTEQSRPDQQVANSCIVSKSTVPSKQEAIMGSDTFKLGGRDWPNIKWWERKNMRGVYLMLWAALVTSATNGMINMLVALDI
jgi:hypothetical protein